MSKSGKAASGLAKDFYINWPNVPARYKAANLTTQQASLRAAAADEHD